MEKTEFPQKVIAFEQSYRQQIERLLEIGTEVSRFWASITSWVSHFFVTLNQIILQEMTFIARVSNLSITRFASLPPLELWLRGTTPQVEEAHPSTEVERASISFVLNLTAAKKIVSDLTKRVAVQTPRSLFLFSPLSGLPEAQSLEEIVKMPAKEPLEAPSEKPSEELLEERARTVFGGADLQRRFESRVASSIKGLTSAIQEYGRQTIWLTPLLAMTKPTVSKVPGRVESLPPRPLVAPPEAVAPHAGLLERPLEKISEPPIPERKEALVEPQPKPQVWTPTVGLSQEAARTFMHAAELPSFLYGMETRALSLPTTATPSPVGPLQITRLIEGASPSLISWIYGESEVLRRTGLSLSAVPIAASTAQKIVTETLVQPISSFEAPLPLPAAESVPTGWPTSRPKTTPGPVEYETFKLPAMFSSIMAAQSQKYPLFFFTEPKIGSVYETPPGPTQVSPEKTVTQEGMAEARRVSKLPTVIALAAAESLIARRLQLEFGSLVKELHVTRSSSLEKLSELGAVGPVGTTMLGRPAEVTPGLSPTLAPFRPTIPSVAPQAPLARPSPPSPPVQNAFNITVSGERTEEDLRDLEKKINQIIAEQVRRYYGSTKI